MKAIMTDKQKNFIKAKAIEQKNKERIWAICPDMQDRSGIYMFYRWDENGNIFARYIGKSETSLIERCASHLNGYKQHLDLSIKNHGLWSAENQTGWQVCVLEYCLPQECDARERAYIYFCTKLRLDLHNVESGGTTGKTDINKRKPARGYRDGVRQGEKNVIKKIAHLFDLHLKAVTINSTPNKMQQKALDKFYEIIQGDHE